MKLFFNWFRKSKVTIQVPEKKDPKVYHILSEKHVRALINIRMEYYYDYDQSKNQDLSLENVRYKQWSYIRDILQLTRDDLRGYEVRKAQYSLDGFFVVETGEDIKHHSEYTLHELEKLAIKEV